MKKFLLSVFIAIFTIIGFGFCDDHIFITRAGTYVNGNWNYTNTEGNITCFQSQSANGALKFTYTVNGVNYQCPNNSNACLFCITGTTAITVSAQGYDLYYYQIPSGSSSCDYSGYILESNIDTEYCVNNNLCPEPELTGGVCTGDNWSALFINGIQHAGAPLISVTIPDYIYWNYTSSEEEFNLDIGSGYDQDFIDGVIDVQSYRPTSEDFTQTFVGGLILFTPYVVVLLFVILVRRLIGRIFKTK